MTNEAFWNRIQVLQGIKVLPDTPKPIDMSQVTDRNRLRQKFGLQEVDPSLDPLELEAEDALTVEIEEAIEDVKEEEKCWSCPDYTQMDQTVEKVKRLREQGYNDNQIASMLLIHQQAVKAIK